jgi:hypothetical protein
MTDFIVDNKSLYNIQYNFLRFVSFIVYVSAFLYLTGFLNSVGFVLLNYVVKILIAIFLIYRFNGQRKNKISLTDLDRKICFSAGVYIIAISFQEYIATFSEDIRKFTKKYNNFRT